MNYRIVIETEKSGRKRYYVQERVYWFFWKYQTEIIDMSMAKYKIWHHSFEEAWQSIQMDVHHKARILDAKIISREKINIDETLPLCNFSEYK